MQVVAGFGCSHTALMFTRADQAPAQQRDNVTSAFETAREIIEREHVDALLMIATDHLRAFPLSSVPSFAIGVGSHATGLGDGGLPRCEVPVHQDLAGALLEGCLQHGADLTFNEEVQIDHSFVSVLTRITPDLQVPIIPVAQNCNVPPRPTLRRSYEVGCIMRQAMAEIADARIAVVATGGLSHWVGSPERRAFMTRRPGTRLAEIKDHPVTLTDVGEINREFDREFLRVLTKGAARQFAEETSSADIEEEAGNGVHEIRNWLTAAAVVDDCPVEVLAYEAIPEWLTGMGVVRFKTEVRDR